MVEIIQIIILVFSIFALSRVFINLRRRNIDRLEGLFWGLFWALAIYASFFPDTIVSIANLLGVGRGVDLVIYGTLIVFAYFIFRLYAQITNIEKKITKIVRTIAIKKNEKKS